MTKPKPKKIKIDEKPTKTVSKSLFDEASIREMLDPYIHKTRVPQKGEALFDHDCYLDMLAELDMEVFFNHNNPPYISSYPTIESIEPGFIKMNEKLYEEELANEEKRRLDPEYKPRKPQRLYMLPFTDKSKITPRIQSKIDKSVKIFAHTQAVTRLFRCFFNLFDKHTRALNANPDLKYSFLSAIFLVFSSMKSNNVVKMIKGVSNSTKMREWCLKFYETWQGEANAAESNIVLEEARVD